MSYKTDMTIEYYNQNAGTYMEDTFGADMSAARERFLKHIPAGGIIMDFGCGSGRDAKAFADAGYNIVALDGSQELCNKAHEVLSQPVICCKFQDYRAMTKFDGVWACASLLHLSEEELTPVLLELTKSLKPGGVLYMSFKNGEFAGERNGRWFTDMTEEQLDELMDQFQSLTLMVQWITEDVREDRNEKWINSIYKKV